MNYIYHRVPVKKGRSTKNFNMIISNCIVFLYVGHHDEIYGKTAEILQKDRTIELLDKITSRYDYL